jgi:hypothetical protein
MLEHYETNTLRACLQLLVVFAKRNYTQDSLCDDVVRCNEAMLDKPS